MLFVDYQELRESPERLAASIQKRLDLDPDISQSVRREVYASVRYRSNVLKHAVHLASPLVRRLGPRLFYRLKFGVLHDVVFARKRIEPPPREELGLLFQKLRPDYENDIDRLESMVCMDLSAWRFESQIQRTASFAAEIREPLPAVSET